MATGQPARPGTKTDTAQITSDKAADEAMRLANAAEAQTVPAPATPVVVPAQLPAPEIAPSQAIPAAKPQSSGTWKWVLGIVLGAIMGFLLARVLTAKPKEVPVALEDENAGIRRRDHRRGQGATPASREEQRISKLSEDEFMQAPMRQTVRPPVPAPPVSPPPASAPPPPTPVQPPTVTKSPKTKPNRSMPAPPPQPIPPASIDELIEASAAAPVPALAPAGPVQFYAPAPDVPSIEHRKLSPNPLPQMPLLIKLTHPDALKAEFSFSPQADQSRIIGNGVRELKEFFAFELPPAEQFTTIKNLTPGKLEKRDDAWHVVQKASIALS
jgi:hypothetical protein